jgi:hypothetical protein
MVYTHWTAEDYLKFVDILYEDHSDTNKSTAVTLAPILEAVLGKKLSIHMVRHRRKIIENICIVLATLPIGWQKSNLSAVHKIISPYMLSTIRFDIDGLLKLESYGKFLLQTKKIVPRYPKQYEKIEIKRQQKIKQDIEILI